MSDAQDREDRRKHLELVSKIIDRMAASSAAAKGWSVALAGAAFGVALVRSNWYLLALGVATLVVFALLDGLYLHNERKFRDLYDAVAENRIGSLAMDLGGLSPRSKNQSYVSWSVLGFYVPLIGAGLILLVISVANHNAAARLNVPVVHSPSAPTPASSAPGDQNPRSRAPYPTAVNSVPTPGAT